MKRRGPQIREFILTHVARLPASVVGEAAKKFRVTRQSVQRHVNELIRQNLLAAAGQTRNRMYRLLPLDKYSFTVLVSAGVEEDRIWGERLRPRLAGQAQNVVQICAFGFTEMFNNVLDHSGATKAWVAFERTAATLRFWVGDNGVGIFHKIAAALGLPDPRESILELSKGKLTTDPKRHSGEGIFFTSRAFDRFLILSGHLSFIHQWAADDWLLEVNAGDQKGTTVVMELDLHTPRALQDVFDQFTGGEAGDYGFTRTHVPVKLARYGDDLLLSRSQAKRVLARFEKFQEVMLDFEGVTSIGQAFADEIFRVFALSHPEVQITPIRTNAQVDKMISRARSRTP